MIRTSADFMRFLLIALFPVFIYPKTAAAQSIASDSMIFERLSEIKTKLADERLRDNRWWYGWLGAYSGATVAQAGVWIAVDELATKQDMALGALTTLLGAAGQMISPLKPNGEWQRIGQLPERTPQEKRIKLLESENLLKQNAMNEKVGRSFKTHAISTAVNLGSSLVTWLAFKRSVWAGLGNFALNEAITETQIFTQPRRAIKDYDNYINKYRFSPVQSTPISMRLGVYPGRNFVGGNVLSPAQNHRTTQQCSYHIYGTQYTLFVLFHNFRRTPKLAFEIRTNLIQIKMKTYAFCPISEKKINERVARLNAAFTVLLISGFFITHNVFFVVFLGIDFFLRTADKSKYSLLAISSKNIVKYLQVRELLINAGPKIFAARIGLIFSSLIVLTYLLNAKVLAFIFAGILGLFSFLEAFIGLCVACEIYPYVYRLLYSRNADYNI